MLRGVANAILHANWRDLRGMFYVLRSRVMVMPPSSHLRRGFNVLSCVANARLHVSWHNFRGGF